MTRTFPLLLTIIITFILCGSASGQTTVDQSVPNQIQNSHARVRSNALQEIAASLSNLPEADTIIYISPQRILNEAVPKVIAPADVAKMRSAFEDIKKFAGVDPARLDYLVISVRFHKPTADLSFVAPDVMAVVSGDFSADSLLTMAHLSLTDAKLRDEKYGSKKLTLMTIDQMTAVAEQNPLLKSFTEVGAVALSPNTLAIGNASYLRSAIDAVDGKARINGGTVESLLRDSKALISAAGFPLSSFAKSFGLLGTESTPRDSRCDTSFGNFYGAVTMDAGSFTLRGAMNADNPDTARIINNLLSSVLPGAMGAVDDKIAQTVMKSVRMTARESEIVWEGDIPEQVVGDFIREQMKPTPVETTPKQTRRPVRKKRVIRK